MQKKGQKNILQTAMGLPLLCLLLIAVILIAARVGSSSFSPAQFWGGLMRKAEYPTQTLILYSIRMPRIFGAVLAGIGLSTAGVLLQGVTGNDLAAPNIIGVNAGAGFAVIVLLCLLPEMALLSPLFAFVGAFAATMLILAVASGVGKSKSNVILTGIAVTALLNAGISFLSMLDTDVLTTYNYFSVGGLSGVRIDRLWLPAVIIAVSLAVSVFLAPRIDTLCLGDEIAAGLGIRVHFLRILCMIFASAAAASVVSFAGLLGFVGLIVPHMARKCVGSSMRRLLPTAALMGAVLVVSADTLGRVLLAPSEIPVGILMALVGAPFFFYLLMQRR